MKDTEEVILNVFKNNSTLELNTETITKKVYPQEYALAEELLNSTDNVQIHDGKRRKFQLHRKLLYYINKLVETNIIKVSKIAEKGEKYFILNIDEGDTTIGKGYKRITITKPVSTSTYIEAYESKGVMKKYEEELFITKFNSILIECEKIPITKLTTTINEYFTNVNDAIALNEFEYILNNSDENSLKEFINSMNKDTENSRKTLSIIINLNQINSVANLNILIDQYTQINPTYINIVLGINNKDLLKYSKILNYIFEKFSDAKIKINFKNNDIKSGPCFKGRAGVYDFDEQDWNTYSKKFKGRITAISCSQSQIAININRFFEVYQTSTEFREATLNAAKTLLLANSIRRRKSNEYFRNINNINYPNSADFYKFNREYIRFWNYDWHKGIPENENLFDLIKSTKELVDNFCHTEETIFKSCGIPLRFKIAFSSAFRNFDMKFMGERDYKKFTINKTEEFHSKDIKTFLEAREKMFEIFDGGDRMRIFRKNEFSTTEIIHELGIILNAYKIPFFTYDFRGLKGTVKLTNFM